MIIVANLNGAKGLGRDFTIPGHSETIGYEKPRSAVL